MIMAQTASNKETSNQTYDFMIQTNAFALNGAVKSYGVFLQKLGKLNDEMMHFCAQRWKQDMEMPARISQMREPGDVAEVYAGFCKKMLQDYSDQAQRVMDLVGRMDWEPVSSDETESVAGLEAAAPEGPAADKPATEKPVKAANRKPPSRTAGAKPDAQ